MFWQTISIVILQFLFTDSLQLSQNEADMLLSFEDRVKKHGYPLEINRLETTDGYVVTLYNIPHGLTNNTHIKNKPPVLLLHGMGGNPYFYTLLGPQRSLPYYLADKGMDVWLLATRSCEGAFGQMHVKYDWNTDQQYWNFSHTEVALYDLAESIDFILHKRRSIKVSLIGHSAGATQFFILLSEEPEYNQKVSVAISYGLAPIVKYIDNPLIAFALSIVDLIKIVYDSFGWKEAIPYQASVLKPFFKEMCTRPKWNRVCLLIVDIVAGYKTHLPVDNLHLTIFRLERFSYNMLLQYATNFVSQTFAKVDYGWKTNLKYYGQRDAPQFNLSAVTAPIGYFIALNEGYMIKPNFYDSANYNIPNAVLFYEIPFDKFTHLDFIFGRNSTELVYEPTFQLLSNYNN